MRVQTTEAVRNVAKCWEMGLKLRRTDSDLLELYFYRFLAMGFDSSTIRLSEPFGRLVDPPGPQNMFGSG